MNIVIIPGFMGYPEETTFTDLEATLTSKGHFLTIVDWPYFSPSTLEKYNFTNTITHAHEVIKAYEDNNLTILGFSMGGIIATVLAKECLPQKLGFIVSPYQAGSEDDLAGKYRQWEQDGIRKVTSSKLGTIEVPFSFIKDAQKYNALNIISEIGCPKLFIAGEKDTRVPPKTARKLFDAADEPKEWHQIPDMEHKYKNQPGMIEKVNEIIVGFINS